jgi:hypothetical protein
MVTVSKQEEDTLLSEVDVSSILTCKKSSYSHTHSYTALGGQTFTRCNL